MKSKSFMTAFWPLTAALTLSYLTYRALKRQSQKMDFNRRVVLITGGSRGLGLILARHFINEGARVAICARDAVELQRAKEMLVDIGGEVLTLVCDLTDETQIRQMVQGAIDHFGQIDVLINNAGIIQVAPFENLNSRDYEHAMDCIFFGTVHTTTAVLKHMIKQHSGRIVNISSIGGAVSMPHLMAYSAAKYAVRGYSEGLAVEAARHGIFVSTILPGLMRTGSYLNATFKGNRDAEMNWFSLSAAMPLLSLNAERAARRIVKACRYGEPFVTIGFSAKVIRLLHDFAPSTLKAALTFVNRALPMPQGNSDERPELGREHETPLSLSPLTSLGQKAAKRYNERFAL